MDMESGKTTSKNRNGYLVKQSERNILIWDSSSNNYYTVSRESITDLREGLAPNKRAKIYLEANTALIKDKEADYDKVISLTRTRKKTADTRKLAELSKEIYKISKEWKKQLGETDNIGMKIARLKDRIPGYEAFLNYQGAMNVANMVIGIGTVIAGSIIANPLVAMGGALYTMKSGEQALKKTTLNVLRNFTSASREHLATFGIYKTIRSFGRLWEDKNKDSESATLNAATTFAKDDVELQTTIGKVRFKDVKRMLKVLQDANETIKDDKDILELYTNGVFTRDDIRALGQKVLYDYQQSKLESDQYDNDLLDWLKQLNYDAVSNQFSLSNGYTLATVEQMHRTMKRDMLRDLLTFRNIVAKTEEPSRRFAEKMMANSASDEGILAGRSTYDIRNFIGHFTNVAVGEYGKSSKLEFNRGGIGALLTLYERFNRMNNTYYTRDIWEGLDKTLNIDFLRDNFGNQYKTDKNSHKAIKNLDVINSEEIGDIFTGNIQGRDINEFTRFKRKALFAITTSLFSRMASIGLMALSSNLLGSTASQQIYKSLGIARELTEELDDNVSMSGSYGAIMDLAILSLSKMIVDEEKAFKKKIITSQNVDGLLKEELGAFKGFFHSSGAGFGYGKLAALPFELGMGYFNYNSKNTKYQKKYNEALSILFARDAIGLAQTVPALSLIANTGNAGLEWYGKTIKNDRDYEGSTLIRDAGLDKQLKVRRKKKKFVNND